MGFEHVNYILVSFSEESRRTCTFGFRGLRSWPLRKVRVACLGSELVRLAGVPYAASSGLGDCFAVLSDSACQIRGNSGPHEPSSSASPGNPLLLVAIATHARVHMQCGGVQCKGWQANIRKA